MSEPISWSSDDTYGIWLQVGGIHKTPLTVTDMDNNKDYTPNTNVPDHKDNSSDTWLKKICGSLDFLRDHVKQSQDEDALKSEWMCLALVLDRVFFLLFVLVIMIICLAFLLHRP